MGYRSIGFCGVDHAYNTVIFDEKEEFWRKPLLYLLFLIHDAWTTAVGESKYARNKGVSLEQLSKKLIND